MDYIDLVPGTYYKGWDAPPPNGKKVWYYFESWQSISNGQAEYKLWLILRRLPGAAWVSMTLNADPNSPMAQIKRSAKSSEVCAEVPPCPADPTFASAPALTAPSATTPSTKVAKVPIPENANSPFCVRCGGPNKKIPLFSFYSYYCPACE